MKRLSPSRIQYEPGEILDHEDVFRVPFGAKPFRSIKQHFIPTSADGPPMVCIRFHTPSHTESGVGYDLSLSPVAFAMMAAGAMPIEVVISTGPNGTGAIIADPLAPKIGFVSGDGKDPEPNRSQWRLHPVTGKLTEYPAPPRPWFKHDSDLYVTMYYTESLDAGEYPPLGLLYRGRDGGEQPIVGVPEGAEGVRIDLGPMGEGVFIPD